MVVLRGAALSGELERQVYVDLEMRHRDGVERPKGHVHISFSDKQEKPGRVRMGLWCG
jgi:hypothetical protein